jgi:ABC-type glycerol-3-phosphate transport system substrate-binding protein
MKSEIAPLSIKAAKTLLAVSLILALMLSLTACSSAPAEGSTDSKPDSYSESRTELTLWTEHMDSEVLNYVWGFNQENKDYYITAVDISDLTQAQIMGKISSGDTPDLYHVCDSSVFFNMNQEQIFEDLNPLMADSDILPAGSILPDLQRCLERNGKLYLLPTDFYFGTVVTYKNSPVDTDLTLAQQEQEAQASNYALFTYYQDPATIWYYLSRMYMYSHVDVESASCDFETPIFIQLLKYCSDPNSNEGGTNLDFRRSVYNFDVFPGSLRLIYFQQEYGDELQLTSSFGSELYLGQCFAISNTSPHKDGAMEVLAYANKREPNNVRFTWPASTKLFRQLMDEYVSTGVQYENEKRFVTFTDNTVEQLYALLANTKGIDQSYPELLAIIDNEAQKCFAGAASPQSAAAQIQSRASIYLSEQYG